MKKKYKHFRVEDFILDESFRDWVLNQNTSAEAFWQEWIKKHPDKRAVVEEAREILLALQPDQPHINQQEMEKGLEEVSAFYQKMMEIKTGYFRKRFLRFSYLLLIVILISMGIFNPFQKKNNFQQHTTQAGEYKKVRLPDGSNVLLREDTRLTYLADWNNLKHRKVNLFGDALFQVRNQLYQGGQSKFIVRTPDLSIEVTGTEFLITQQDCKTQICLKSGVIHLKTHRDKKSLTMMPGDMAEYDASENKLTIEHKE